MKTNINLLCNFIKNTSIFFKYYFITNNNVTIQLIARYIVLKLKKGFSVMKILNPLKRELVRVSKKGRELKGPIYLIIIN